MTKDIKDLNGQELEALFESVLNEYCSFNLVEPKLAERPDLHGLMLLDRIIPKEKDGLFQPSIIYAAKFSAFFLDIDIEQFKAVATRETVIELVRCGYSFDAKENRLCRNLYNE